MVRLAWHLCEKMDLPREAMFAGVTEKPAFLLNVKNRIPWDTWVQIVRNAARLAGGRERWVAMNREFGRDSGLSIFRRLSSSFVSPEQLYRRFQNTILPANYSHIETGFTKVREGEYIVTVSLPKSYTACREWLECGEPTYEMLPSYIGLPDARVELLEISGHHSKLRVFPPSSRTLRSRVMRIWSQPDAHDSEHWLLQEQVATANQTLVQLRQQMEEFRGALEATSDAVCIVRDGTIQFANGALAQLLQVRDASSLVGLNSSTWLSDEQIEDLRAWAQEAEAASQDRRQVKLSLGESAEALVELARPRTILWAGQPATLWLIKDVTDRVKLERALSDAAQREQRRIAHDLHDGLGQVLTAAAFKAKVLVKSLNTITPETAALAGEVYSLVSEATGQARDIAHGLAPLAQGGNSLTASLLHLTNEVSRLFEIDCHFRQEGPDPRLSSEIASQIYRVAQEAINNAVRHGKAQRLEVRFVTQETGIQVEIVDNGSGFQRSQNEAEREGFGIRIMRHRIQSINGLFEIQNLPGEGVTVRVSVPYRHFEN